MTVHLITPTPHRSVGPTWAPDAYCGKAWRLCSLLADVVFYGSDDDQVDVAHVPIITAADRHAWFGAETWTDTVFNDFDPTGPCWKTVNERAIAAIRERIEPTDIIGITMGTAQSAIAAAFPGHVVAEVGVGYEGIVAGTHRCYESYAWMHYLWGKTGVTDGRWFDTVIPNAYDPADYLFRSDHDGYLLFMARHTERKGLEVVRELARHHRVVTAGQGGPLDGCEYAGVVRGKEKAELLAGARAVLCPTGYIEPFGGVAVEAMLSGTPVITSSFGAFTETVADGISGYRCHTLDQFRRAVDALDDLDPKTVHEWAADRFTLAVVAPQYDRWLRRLATLYGRGWYE